MFEILKCSDFGSSNNMLKAVFIYFFYYQALNLRVLYANLQV